MLLIDRFLQNMEETINKIQALMPNRLVESGNRALLQAVRQSDKVFFETSTMEMLIEELQRFEEVTEEVLAAIPEGYDVLGNIAQFRGTWVWFSQTMKTPAEIEAMFCFNPSHYLESGKDRFHLYLINRQGETVYMMWSLPGEEWQFDHQFHHCPAESCRVEGNALLPCEACQVTLVIWSEIFALSAIIAGQYLAAKRYEEREFSGVRRMPRQRNAKKTKAVAVKYLFKVIDANEIIIPVPKDEQPQRQELHSSWLQDAIDENNVVYEEKTTRPFERVYRHPRYIHMQGQSTSFPGGIKRMQPMRKDLIGKRVTKVKASEYEQ